jgi:cytoskeletal protein RodZ
MSDHERGAYTPPTDEPLSFDARQPVRGARPFPFTLLISALVLVGLVAAIVVFYRSGVRQAGQAPQTVGEPIGELKAAAPTEAQPQDPAAGLQIYSDETTGPSTAAPQFTAPPEQPQPRVETPPVVLAPPAAAPTTPVAQGPVLRPALPSAPAAAPAAAPAPAQAAPAKTVVAPPPKAAAPAPAPAPAPAKATAEPAAKPAGGAAAVQIGAYSSQALADKGWSDAVAIAGGGHGKSVQKVEKDGKTFFRTAVTGFPSRTEASAYCAKLKAAGKACFVR